MKLLRFPRRFIQIFDGQWRKRPHINMIINYIAARAQIELGNYYFRNDRR